MAEGPGPQEQSVEPTAGLSPPAPGTSRPAPPGRIGALPAHELARLDPARRAGAVARLQGVAGNAQLARLLQRDPAPPDPAAPPAAGAAAAAPAAPAQTPAAGCIVDDAVEQLEPHQQRRSQVLAALRTAAAAAAEAALSGSPWAPAARGRVTSELEALFATYAAQDAATLERTLRVAAPGASAATSATALVGAVAAEVGRSVAQALPKDDPLSAGMSAVSGVSSAVANLLFKRRRGARRPAADPLATLGELGRGHALGGSERGRMEEAFGTSFSDVRVHTDAVAADLAGQSDARAFSIGRSIAFGAGEYRPGTLEGDALIAHELAHVVQQRDAPGVAAPVADVSALEADADSAAIDAAVGLHLGERGALAGLRRTAVARLRSGIALRSCGPEKKPEIAATQQALGESVKKGMDTKANAPKRGDSGLHYWFNYETNSKKNIPGYLPWKPDWQFGYTAAPQFKKEGPFTWRMRVGESPSAALAAWLGGLTIADCASVAVALQHDAVRAAVGNAKFDEIFRLNLLINQYTNVNDNPDIMKFLADTGQSEPQIGDLYYFSNHKHYKYKHPAGAWTGENAIYAGDGKWSGFGAADKKESDMLAAMLSEYDKDRTPADERQIEREKRENGGVMPKEYVYGTELDGEPFKEKLGEEKVLLKGGGGRAKSGLRVDASKVAPKVPPK